MTPGLAPIIESTPLLDQVHDDLDIGLLFAATPGEIAELLADATVTIAEQARDREATKMILTDLIATLMEHYTKTYVLPSGQPIRQN